MSVLAFISDAKNKAEQSFSIPVASEQFFNNVWLQGINKLDLKILAQIQYGLEFEKFELPVVISELDRLLNWAYENLKGSDRELIEERIKLLMEKLPEAFMDNNIKIYIG